MELFGVLLDVFWTGLPQGERLQCDERVPRRLRGDERQLDVFCCVKQNMSDGFLCQNPLLVLPQTLMAETESFINRVNSARSITPSLAPERMEELELLAKEISEDYPHMSRTVTFYKSLLDDAPRLQPYPRLKFIESLPRAGNRWCQFNLGEMPPRPKPHPLQVVFHRGGG